LAGYPERSVVVPNPVVHFEITGADGSALQSFYRDLFDWKIDANNEWQYGMVETGGEGGINGGISGNQDGSARVSVYAAVDDLQAYLDKAERLGARVVMPVTDMGDFAIAMFADPAGNVTGLINGGDS
jgi:uncharacterized protein